MGRGARQRARAVLGVGLCCAACLDAPPAATDALGDGDAAGADAATSFTVASNPDLDIPDIGPEVEDAIDVLPRCEIAELSVDIYIMHPYRGDLVLDLSAPNGALAQLKSFNGADTGDDLIGNYPASLEPDDSLSLFAELEARGSWTLGVRDVGQNDAGTLRNWTLNLTCL